MPRWTDTQARFVIRLFEKGKADPEQESPEYIKSVASNYSELKPFFSRKQGGENSDNRALHTGYRNAASEYITMLAKKGIRRSE
jgi:hypothetical protein